MIKFHYAVQVCDTKSNQGQKRYCGDDRTLLTKKSLTSLLYSIEYCIQQKPESIHHINFIEDQASKEAIDYIKSLIQKYSSENIILELNTVSNPGIMSSIRDCYQWLTDNGENFVYQIQDDYLFNKTAIYEMANIWFQLYYDTDSNIIVQPYNEYYHWITLYRYQSTPRVIVPGQYRYWIQLYDIPCSFMTNHAQFIQHWDLYEIFLNRSSTDTRLEADSLNHIMTRRGQLCLTPLQSLTLHMQSELEKDPYTDWEKWWNQVKVD